MHSADDAHAIPSRTTPTWELELLISGATVFGLLQLPEKISEVFIGWVNSADEVMSSFVIPLGIYLQFSALMLAMTFVLHLCLRGYWVALVGINSVYPQGIDWRRLNLGPFALEAAQRAAKRMGDRIEAADNRATRVFAVGFGIAMAMFAPIVVVGALLVITYLTEVLHGDVRLVQTLFWIVFALLFAPPLMAMLLDRRAGQRIDPNGFLGRAMRFVLGLYARVGVTRSSNPLLALYTSHIGRRKAGVVVTGLMMPAMAVSVLMLVGNALDSGAMAFAGLPGERKESAFRINAKRYDSLRGDDRSIDPQPFIPDPVVSGPYLKLFIPYVPRRYNPIVERECGEAVPARDTDGGAALACLKRLQPLTLDGKPVDAPWFATRDSKTQQRGMLVMIPVASLAEGPHELVLTSLPRIDKSPPKDPVRIPFWK